MPLAIPETVGIMSSTPEPQVQDYANLGFLLLSLAAPWRFASRCWPPRWHCCRLCRTDPRVAAREFRNIILKSMTRKDEDYKTCTDSCGAVPVGGLQA